MGASDSITRAALDTLSSQVAVLDEDGRILFTNSTWGTVDGVETSPEVEGVNYFDAVDPTTDDYAIEAVRGIRAVLAVDRESFSMEYPCHTDEKRQWFMMRATPFTLGGEKFATVAHIDITDRRLAELEARANAERADRERRRLEHLVERINGLVQDITELLVEAEFREEVEEGVCERLAAADPYVYAWIGNRDLSADALSVRAAAGSADVDVAAASYPLSGDIGDPTVTAFSERAVHVAQSVGPGTRLGRIYGESGVEALIAVPLVNRDTTYGVLTVCADRADAFDEREQVVLEALGRATANALNAIESRRTLTANRIVEMEFTVDDESLFPAGLFEATGCTLSYSGSVYDDGTVNQFYRVRDGDPEAVLAVAAGDDAVVEAALIAEYEEESLFQFTLASPLVTTLADRGAVTQEVTATDGVARFTVELPQEADARSLFEFVADRYDGTELVGYHEHERPVRTDQEFRAGLRERLTDRQLTALRMAYYSGFFDWPRGVDGDELAAMMDISRSTFHQAPPDRRAEGPRRVFRARVTVPDPFTARIGPVVARTATADGLGHGP